MRPRRTPRSVRLFGFAALTAALSFSSFRGGDRPAIASQRAGANEARQASGEFRLERQFPLDRGGTFALDSAAGRVDVVGDSPSGVSVTVTSNREDTDKRFEFLFDNTPQLVKLTIKRRDRFEIFGDWLRGGLQITVHVPNDAMVDARTVGGGIDASRLANARLRTSGGSVHAETIAGDLDGHTSGGSIRVREIRGRASVETSGGSIDASEITGSLRAHTSDISNVAGDVDAGTSGGSVDARGIGGRVAAHTSGGSISVTFATGNNHGGDLSTSGGGVRAEIDPSVALSIDASTSGGSVTADVPVTVQGNLGRRKLQGHLNGGGEMLRLHTSGGSIRISPAPASTARR
jgi:DUF4097 and DUF4098 domain-containing protein YvlB